MEKARGTVPSGDTRERFPPGVPRNPSARLETRRLPIDHRDRENERTNVSSRCEEISFSAEEDWSWRFETGLKLGWIIFLLLAVNSAAYVDTFSK